MKEELIKRITETMVNISKTTNEDSILANGQDFTIKYDIKNEFVFVSLSNEDLTDVCYTTYCDPALYSDVSMYDLECLNDYSLSDLEVICDLLAIINGNL
jgi:hypothetical protein